MSRSHFGSPRLHLAAADFHRRSALAADQVMVMMRRRATAVDRFAGVGTHHVDQISGGQRLQGAVDGGQTDIRAAATKLVMQFLCGSELLDGVEQCDDRSPLPGGAYTCARGPLIAIGNHFHLRFHER